MHPISSWMITIDLRDELELVELASGSIARFATLWHEDAPRKGEIDWPFATDLVARAHALLEKTVARELPVQSTLYKRIPLGGGLGGGSADAAAMLLGLNRLFNLELGIGKLTELASQLGSDVPFLLHGGSAIVEGLGENIELMNSIAPLNAVLVFPSISCPTSRVYSQFDAALANASATLQSERVRALAASSPPDDPFNDLAEPAFTLFPELRNVADSIAAIAEAPAHMTGSGSTLFLRSSDPIHAEHLAAAITERLGLPAKAVSSCAGVAVSEQSAENA
jgi:4-diphosphocytidyl-2-C-methyl-D-erythritol kinase